MLCSGVHNYNTAASSASKLLKSSPQNNLYVENSITISAINLMLGIQNKQPLEMSFKNFNFH